MPHYSELIVSSLARLLVSFTFTFTFERDMASAYLRICVSAYQQASHRGQDKFSVIARVREYSIGTRSAYTIQDKEILRANVRERTAAAHN